MLQAQWKRIRDRYVRGRRKRKLQQNCSEGLLNPMSAETFLLRDFVKAETANRRRFANEVNNLFKLLFFRYPTSLQRQINKTAL